MPATNAICRLAAVFMFVLAGISPVKAAATITIINQNAPGEGFNDPTPVAPVGGNPGTTIGEQRLIAFHHAANIWAAALTSNVPIRIGAAFVPLDCSVNGAVVGSAGPYEAWSDFPNAPRRNTWYPAALASKLASKDLTAPSHPHIVARFNSRLGLAADCLPGSAFYLGLDNKAGSRINLVTVLLHEMAHGLGFQTFTDEKTGERLLGTPSVWDWHLVDNRTGIPWVGMTDVQRAASAVTWRGLSWNGRNVNNAISKTLTPRRNLGISGSNAGLASGNYYVGEASFGPPLTSTPVSGQLMPVVDQADGNGWACKPLDNINAQAVRNNIALVDRGGCDFPTKARVVQASGALGMVLVDNVPGNTADLTGTDSRVKIPAVRVTLEDGKLIKASLQQRSPTMSGVIASLSLDASLRAGADNGGRILMYTPGALAPGSSVSHFTTEAKSNQLMEPSINTDLLHMVNPPHDLTYPLLRDIGW